MYCIIRSGVVLFMEVFKVYVLKVEEYFCDHCMFEYMVLVSLVEVIYTVLLSQTVYMYTLLGYSI